MAEEEGGSLHGCFYYSLEKSTGVWKTPDNLLNPVFSHGPVEMTSHLWSVSPDEVLV